MKLLMVILAVRFLIEVVEQFMENKKVNNVEEKKSIVKHPAEFQLRW